MDIEDIRDNPVEDVVSKFTGLPQIHIMTSLPDSAITKDSYIEAFITIKNSQKDSQWDTDSIPGKIKGRGHFTWTQPKKPYKIKFDDKVPVLGLPEDKEWVLLANYTDKSCLRNDLAFTIGYSCNSTWTPRFRFVELFYNNEYKGQYQLVESIKRSKYRVNISKEGFLLEIDHPARLESSDVYFSTQRNTFVLKDSKVASGSQEYLNIKNTITTIENVLFSEDYADPVVGYRRYLNTLVSR